MWLTDFFKPTYRVALESKVCLGCSARQSHIEDLQNLLKSEREGNATLQTLLFQKAGFITSERPETSAEPKPLRTMQTISQLRRKAEQKEAVDHPDAKKDYWAGVQEEYAKVGKLP